jgi:hypothetical protein
MTMHIKKRHYLLPLVGLAALVAARSSYAQSADALIDKLVDKGILSVKEANDLREETDKGFNAAYQVKSGLPDWVTNLRIGGDFRARYDSIFSDNDGWPDRNRFRFRVRPGIYATLKDNFEVGFRLTSGEARDPFGGDPISGNVSYQDNASKKSIYIDQAFGKWTFLNNPSWFGSFTIGKMENPFVFSDMIFDPDYTPEGAAQQFGYNINESHGLKLNLGEFVLDEVSASNSDPYMFGAQLRLESVWTPHIATSIGLSALAITAEQNLQETPASSFQVVDTTGATRTVTTPASSAVPNVNTGNTRVNGVLANNFNPLIADVALTYTLDSFPLYNAAFPIRVGGEYANNPAGGDKNEAYSFGVTLGKSGKKGLWDLAYKWKHMERDFWYEEVVDSDFGGFYPPTPTTAVGRPTYGPGTNLEGHVIRANYSFYDSLTFGVTYYLAHILDGDPPGFDKNVNRIQVDAIWKF